MPDTGPFAVVSFAPMRNQLAVIEGLTSLVKKVVLDLAEWRNLMAGMVEYHEHSRRLYAPARSTHAAVVTEFGLTLSYLVRSRERHGHLKCNTPLLCQRD
jgi:hypothetical protein